MLKNKDNFKNFQAGFAPLAILLVLAVIAIIGVTGVYVYQNKSRLSATHDHKAAVPETTTAKANSDASYKPLSEADVATLQSSTPVSTPAPNTATNKSAAPKTSAPGPASVAPETPAATPSPAPKASGVISFSGDGCMVTGTGTPGLSFEIGAFTARKGGGGGTMTLPASGTLTTSSGGQQTWTSYGRLTDASGAVIAYASATVTAAACPPAGPF